MVILVIFINLFISIIFFYLAIQIWLLKQKLVLITNSLNSYQIIINEILYTSIASIYTGKEQIHNLRYKNQILQLQIQKLRQILDLIILGRNILQKSI
ncbi:MAG: hypothetical protein EAZ76_09380 [Nostocales cyanobacterium]|nr:MAG: hypothetical protein EAZ87_02970 [Nostocales cyanobacterium]TAF14661.1 MAG: hypothetical protein EAZ76_09380 [Nostocales cyanobacterium]